MNNRQAGRRRGRGGQRQGGNPGRPDNGNRIDNRARGNAAQLLEKYKNLASDAQRSGDRVTTEYYLQFADHYFRVLSESRSRMEDGQQGRRQQMDDDGGDDEFGYEGEIASPAAYGAPVSVRDDEDEQDARREEMRREPRRANGNDRLNGDRDDRPRRERSDEDDAPRRQQRFGRDRGETRGDETPRDPRPVPANDEAQAERPRRGRPRRDAAGDGDGERAGFDAAILPPAIAVESGDAEPAAEDRPRRGRPRRVRTDDEAIPPAA